jgi:hemoglobin
MDGSMDEDTLYRQLGGATGLRALVVRFYELMDELPEARGIRELHPLDLNSSVEKLFMFLSGFLGGPPLYVKEFGHPRLRARHLPFPIGVNERDQWVLCMETALQENVASETLRLSLLSYFKRTADHMRNSDV